MCSSARSSRVAHVTVRTSSSSKRLGVPDVVEQRCEEPMEFADTVLLEHHVFAAGEDPIQRGPRHSARGRCRRSSPSGAPHRSRHDFTARARAPRSASRSGQSAIGRGRHRRRETVRQISSHCQSAHVTPPAQVRPGPTWVTRAVHSVGREPTSAHRGIELRSDIGRRSGGDPHEPIDNHRRLVPAFVAAAVAPPAGATRLNQPRRSRTPSSEASAAADATAASCADTIESGVLTIADRHPRSIPG